MKNNLILIGMPGVGKSTAGVILAKVLNFTFLDSDLLIQHTTGKRLKDLIAEKGTDGFIALENEINAGITAENTVIATGGSVVYGREAMGHLRQIGTIVYLKIDYVHLDHRLGDLEGRGVVHRAGQSLEELYRERTALYERYADLTVDVNGKNVAETVDAVCHLLEENKGDEADE